MAYDSQRDPRRTRPARILSTLRAWLRRLASDRRGGIMPEYVGATLVCALALTVTYREFNTSLTQAVSTRVGLISTGNKPQVLSISGQAPSFKPGQAPPVGTNKPPTGTGKPPPVSTTKPPTGTSKPPTGTNKPPTGTNKPPGNQTCTGPSCPAGSGNCFGPGTLVYTADGDRPIESIEMGDLVWSRSDETGELALKPVVATFVTEDQRVFDLGIESGDRSEQLTVTEGHPFWVERLGWVESDEIEDGALLWSPEGALTSHAGASWGARTKVYNFEVEDFHTYFVGSLHAWVHNAPKCPLECGDHGTYNELNQGAAQAQNLERDHVPSNAALAYRAMELYASGNNYGALDQNQIDCLTKKEPTGNYNANGEPTYKKSILEKFAGSIGGIGEAIAIPKDVHAAGRTHSYKNTTAQIQADAADLQQAAENDTKAILDVMPPGPCRDKYDWWSRVVARPISNQEYDRRLKEKMNDSRFRSIKEAIDNCLDNPTP